MINWFATNNLVLSVDKMNIMKLITKNSSHSTLNIGDKENYVEGTRSRDRNLVRGEIFRTCPDQPSGPPSLLYNGYRIFFGDKAAGAWH